MTPSDSSRSTLLLSTIALGALLAVACSSTTASTPTGTSGGTSVHVAASAADCASRCEAEFMKCGDDAATAKSNCSSHVCNARPSAEELTCLEAKSCDSIASLSFGAFCVTCGGATCAATEYCALNYEYSGMTYSAGGSCKAVPASCASKTGDDFCTCMKANAGCPASGVVQTKCSVDNGGLSFGCHN